MERIEQVAANEIAYNQIQSAITSGRFKPGEVLSTRQLAKELGVSQMPVREAFQRLVADGVLEKRANRTIALRSMNVAEFEELTELRMMLEGLAAERAAGRLNARDTKKLKKLATDMESCSENRDDDGHIVHNREFHFVIYRGAGSPHLLEIIERIWLRIGPFLRLISRPKESRRVSDRNHRALIEAIQERDSNSAREHLVKDIRDGSSVVREYLSELEVSERAEPAELVR